MEIKEFDTHFDYLFLLEFQSVPTKACCHTLVACCGLSSILVLINLCVRAITYMYRASNFQDKRACQEHKPDFPHQNKTAYPNHWRILVRPWLVGLINGQRLFDF